MAAGFFNKKFMCRLMKSDIWKGKSHWEPPKPKIVKVIPAGNAKPIEPKK